VLHIGQLNKGGNRVTFKTNGNHTGMNTTPNYMKAWTEAANEMKEQGRSATYGAVYFGPPKKREALWVCARVCVGSGMALCLAARTGLACSCALYLGASTGQPWKGVVGRAGKKGAGRG
jgi:hypothetical protein